VNAEFNWWLLIVGLVVGAALTWLVMAESARRDADVGDDERRSEAVWISSLLSSPDRPVEPRRVEEILRLHGEYLAGPPPDELEDSDEFDEPGVFDPIDDSEVQGEYDVHHVHEHEHEHDELEAFEAAEAERASAAAAPFEPGKPRPKTVGIARRKSINPGTADDAAAPTPDEAPGAPTAPAPER